MQRLPEKQPFGGLRGDTRKVRRIFILLTVLFAILPHIMGYSLSYGDGSVRCFWLLRVPWGIGLLVTGFLYGHKAFRIIPLALTVFIAFPELFLYLFIYIAWGLFGYSP